MPATGDIRFIDVEATLPLRSLVLREGRPFAQCRFAEDGEPGSFHLGYLTASSPSAKTRIVGITSLYRKELAGETGVGIQLRGMAVLPELQGSGIGAALLEFAERQVREQRLADYFWCNARVHAIPFYERHDWRVASEEFEIPEVGPHRRMVKRL